MPGSVADALRTGDAFARYLNSPAAAGLDGAACGEVLIALGGIQAKLAAAYADFLRRFDAADAHNADGYSSSSAWLAAKAQLTKRDARAAVRQMRQFGQRKHLAEALATGGITDSWAAAIADWTKKLPAEMRDETDRILLEGGVGGSVAGRPGHDRRVRHRELARASSPTPTARTTASMTASSRSPPLSAAPG